jgi:mannosyltransferase
MPLISLSQYTSMNFFNKLLKNKETIFLLSILLLNAILKALYLDANPIDMDEPFSIFHAQMGVSDIVHALKNGNNPPLYEICLHFWIKVFGISSFSVRLPSLLFSVITVLFVYLVAKRFFNIQVAVLSTLLITFSSYHLFFAHEARVYALFALLTTISFYLFYLIVDKKANISTYIFLFLTYVCVVYSHYFGIVVIGLQTGFLFFNPNKAGVIKRYFIVLAALILAYGVYVPVVIQRFTESASKGTWLLPVENLGNLFDLIFYFANNSIWLFLAFILILWGAIWKFIYRFQAHKLVKKALLYGLVPLFFLSSFSIFFPIPFFWRLTSSILFIHLFAIAILFFLFLLGFIKKKIPQIQSFTIAWFLLPLLSFFLVSFHVPVFLDRYLIFIMPAFYITIGLSVHYLFQNKRNFYIASIIITLLAIATFKPSISNNRFSDQIAMQIHQMKTSQTKVILCPEHSKLAFAYHYNIEYFKDYNNLMLHLQRENIYPIHNQNELQQIIEPTDPIIYIDSNSELLNPENGIFDYLNSNYFMENEFIFADSTRIYVFENMQP